MPISPLRSRITPQSSTHTSSQSTITMPQQQQQQQSLSSIVVDGLCWLLKICVLICGFGTWYACLILHQDLHAANGIFRRDLSIPLPVLRLVLVLFFCNLCLCLIDTILDPSPLMMISKAWAIFCTLVNGFLSLVPKLGSFWPESPQQTDTRPGKAVETRRSDLVEVQEYDYDASADLLQSPDTSLEPSKHTCQCLVWKQTPTANASASIRIAPPTTKVSQQLVRDQDDLSCALCWEEYKAGDVTMLLPCSHRYHMECVQDWVREKFDCPYCRQGFKWTLALKNEKATPEKLEA